MDEYLIRKWNHMIGIADTVVLLGDVSLCGSARTKELVRRLNGVKFLVVGNHDKSKPLNWWRELFLDAFDTPLKINNVIYSHEPVTPQYLEEHQAIANVHGHTHSKFIDDPRYICVSVEQTYFQPVWRE
jgi:calcineurin-like phosphoesterase family protein